MMRSLFIIPCLLRQALGDRVYYRKKWIETGYKMKSSIIIYPGRYKPFYLEKILTIPKFISRGYIYENFI